MNLTDLATRLTKLPQVEPCPKCGGAGIHAGSPEWSAQSENDVIRCDCGTGTVPSRLMPLVRALTEACEGLRGFGCVTKRDKPTRFMVDACPCHGTSFVPSALVRLLDAKETPCPCDPSSPGWVGACQSCWKGEGSNDGDWGVEHDGDCEVCHSDSATITTWPYGRYLVVGLLRYAVESVGWRLVFTNQMGLNIACDILDAKQHTVASGDGPTEHAAAIAAVASAAGIEGDTDD